MAEEANRTAFEEEKKRQEQHDTCEELLARIRLNPNVLYLQKALKQRGCGGKSLGFQCLPCQPLGVSAEAFFRSDGTIAVCEDSQTLVRNSTGAAVLHELVHAYDYCRADMTPTCSEIACTEIRASLLSGECGFVQELARGNNGLRKQMQRCVRRRVELSMAMHPQCAGLQGEKAVSDVWDVCYADRAPFDTMPVHYAT